ncbi:MAG: FtsW/RodA/SpoVE family cell cycle protein [Firmicutes bacterium]|nr:FtsW/RodA/SpoVE family cell cycle protein [Bacillota bacterium]
MEKLIAMFAQADPAYVNVFRQILRFGAPVLAGLLLFRCILPLLTFRREPEIWAWLVLTDGRRLPISHWESVIGRSKRSDVVIDVPTVSRNHAVLTRYDDGSWTISDAGSKGGVLVNGEKVTICALEPEDVIDIGGVEMTLLPISRRQEIKLAQLRTKATSPLNSIANVLLLTLFQCLCCIAYLFTTPAESGTAVLTGFGGIALCQWALLIFYLFIRKPSFEVEAIAFFLCTMGMAAISAVKPGEAVKQLIAIVMGLALFLAVGWSLRDLERAKKVRYIAAAAGIGFLILTLLFGKEYHGAKNWLIIGGMSFQPSELSKVCFVFVGASTMERLVNKRNLILFIAYTLAICACLAVMNDFGTALIFFVAFLLIAYMRSGSVGTIALACTSLGFASVIALKIAPHALRRFTSWRHIWENPLTTGYQQTRALMCIASGGLFGMGAGKGWMKNVFAADSDVVFATLAEEWGLLICLMLIVCILALGIFALRSAAVQRSSFFAIGGCTAAGILLVQAIFNALGTVDVLPLTGVTFPFVSNGGSSMIGVWGLLAFVKAADTRQNASFAVRQSKEGRPDDE